MVDQDWLNTTTGVATDRLQYGYDDDDDLVSANNLINSAQSILYAPSGVATDTAYDLAARLTAYQRGALSASGTNGSNLDTVANPNRSQSFSLDNMSQHLAIADTSDRLANQWRLFVIDRSFPRWVLLSSTASDPTHLSEQEIFSGGSRTVDHPGLPTCR